MKTQIKKILSLILVFALVLTSSAGFIPKTAEAAPNSTIYTYGFEHENAVTEIGNRKLVVTLDSGYTLAGITDPSKIVVSEPAEIRTIQNEGGKLAIYFDSIDPTVANYTVTIKVGAIAVTGYSQLSDFVINFKSYDVTPGFKSLFKTGGGYDANKIFNMNNQEDISLFVNSGYVTNITAVNKTDGVNWTEITITTKQPDVHSIRVNVNVPGQPDRKTAAQTAGVFKVTYSDIVGIKDINVFAYNETGSLLEKAVTKNNFGTAQGTNFDPALVKTFAKDSYTVKEVFNGTISIGAIIAGRTYNQLDGIKVHYANVEYIMAVSNSAELAYAITELKKLPDTTKALIKLKSDITYDAAATLQIDKPNLTLNGSDNGTNHTINGNVKLGNGTTSMSVKLKNVTVNGNVDVDVTATGTAYLENVTIAAGKTLTVTSGGTASVYLTNVITERIIAQNNGSAVRLVALNGTQVGKTDISGTKDVILVQQGGVFSTGTQAITKASNLGKLILQGDATNRFAKVVIPAGLASAPLIQLINGTVVDLITANSNTDIIGPTIAGQSATITNLTAGTGVAVGYDWNIILTNPATGGTVTAGSNVPASGGGGSSTAELPSAGTATISLSGNVYTSDMTTKADLVGGSLIMILDGPTSWANGIVKADIAAVLAQTGLHADVIAATSFILTRNSDKMITITWTTTGALSLAAGVSGTVTLDDTDVDFDKDLFKADAAYRTIDDTNFTAYYKPAFGTNTLGAKLNKFTVHGAGELTAIGIESIGGTGTKIHNNGSAAATIQYSADNRYTWTDATIAVGGSTSVTGTVSDLYVRVKGSLTDTKYSLVATEVWVPTKASIALVTTHLATSTISAINLYGETDTVYDTSGAAIAVTSPKLVQTYAGTAKLGLNTAQPMNNITIGQGVSLNNIVFNATPTTALTENTLDETVFTLKVYGDEFEDGITGSAFTVTGSAVTGISVASATVVDAETMTLTIAYDGSELGDTGTSTLGIVGGPTAFVTAGVVESNASTVELQGEALTYAGHPINYSNGFVNSIVTITLEGDTFANEAFVSGAHYELGALSGGITAVMNRTSDTTLELVFGGANTSGANSTPAAITFTALAFNSGNVNKVTTSVSSITFNYQN